MNKNTERLLDGINTTVDIACSKCGHTKTVYNFDEIDFANYLDEAGWYATEMDTYCPSCNSKRKSKNARHRKS